MTQYIDKNTLVAEIKKIYDSDYKFLPSDIVEGIQDFKDDVLRNIDTLEVKEVDLEEEINHWQGCEAFPEGVNITPLPKAMDIVERTAKYFFELGLNAQKGE